MIKKYVKQILMIITLIVILFALYKIAQTYAVFYNEANGTITQKQANWIIKINNADISSGVEKEFVVDQFECNENSHIMPGKIAPSVTGDFYITIDPTNTDVAVKYEIKMDKSNLVNEKIQILSIEEVENNISLTETEDGAYSAIMSLDDIKAGKINKIKVTISWENDEENNEEDTKIGTVKNPTLQIPITINVSQYLGE